MPMTAYRYGMAFLVAAIWANGLGCSDAPPALCRPVAPCPSGWSEYSGSSCDHWGACWSYGDGLCYRRCETDTDCTDPGFEVCNESLKYYQQDQSFYLRACGSRDPVPVCGAAGGP
jgi:hypothetical protein